MHGDHKLLFVHELQAERQRAAAEARLAQQALHAHGNKAEPEAQEPKRLIKARWIGRGA
jgi:hypothetical protein